MRSIYNYITRFKILKKVVPKFVRDELREKLLNNPYSKLEDKHKFIFVHIPKTAGNGIIKSLFDKKAMGHYSVIKYKKYNKNKFKKYYKFTIVRNPWDRLVSAFFYLKQGGMSQADREFSNRYIQKHDNFEEFILSLEDEEYKNIILSWIHFIPQYNFVYHKGKCLVDYIGKFENLEKSYKVISKKLNINKKLKKHNASKHKAYYKYYNKKMIDIVYKLYKKDIKLLNYNFPYKKL